MVDIIKSYLNELKLNGMKEGTITGVSKVLNRLNKFRSLEECTAEDVKSFLSQGEKNTNTIAIYKSYIRKFFLWHRKPEVVNWIGGIRRPKKKLDENALLTADDIAKMLNAAYHPRDKALIALLSESGARISELLSLDISNVQDTDYGAVVRIPDKDGNKTGSREIPIIDSIQYIKAWLNQYPRPVTQDKPLFISFNQSTRFERLTYEGAFKVIKKIAKEAGITKRVHPHLFRHTQLTDMARQGYNESIIRRKAGWTGDSKMVDIYIHTTNRDLETAVLAKHGLMHIQRITPQIQLTKECPVCHKAIPIEAQFCENCSKHQDLSPVVKRLITENQEVLHTQEKLREQMQIIRSELDAQKELDMSLSSELEKRMNELVEKRADEILERKLKALAK